MAKDSFGQGHPFPLHQMEVDTLKVLNAQGFHPEIYLQVPSDCIVLTGTEDTDTDEE